MGFGLVLGALSGGANAAGASFAQADQFRQQQELEQQRNAMRIEAEKAAAQHKYDLDHQGEKSFGNYLKSVSGTQIPVAAAPVVNLDESGAKAAGLSTSGISGNLEELRNKAVESLNDPNATPEQIDNVKMLLDQLDLQEKGQEKANKDAVAGKTKLPSTVEAIKLAIQKAAESGDTAAIKAGKAALGDILVHMSGNASMYNVLEGKPEYVNDQGMKVQQEKSKTALKVAEMRAKSQAKKELSSDGLFSERTLDVLADQALAGDTSVYQNVGRGTQGAANLVALRNRVIQKADERGISGSELAAINSEYFGTKAGQRAVGTRIANVEMAASEAAALIPLAKEASDAVSRSGFLPFGKGQIMFDNQTNDPDLRKFATANNAVVNAYARAISPSGVPTVSDKDHAREMINTAMDQKSYNAVLDQMMAEIEQARKSPKTVRKEFSDEVTQRQRDATAKGVEIAPNPAQQSNGRPSLQSIFGD